MSVFLSFRIESPTDVSCLDTDEGFRLTYGGLDYLALRTFSRRKTPSVSAVGQKIGVGKESDIYLVKGDSGDERVLKIQRSAKRIFTSAAYRLRKRGSDSLT